MTPSITSEPCFASCPLSDISSGVKTALTLARRRTAKLLIILRMTVPPEISSTLGAIVSAIVFTALAPIASLQSTWMCTITILPESVSITLAERSLQPPPNFTSMGSTSLQFEINSSLAARIDSMAPSGSSQPTTWIWPIMTGSSLSELKPPLARHLFAMLLAAATTLGSSRTNGIA